MVFMIVDMILGQKVVVHVFDLGAFHLEVQSKIQNGEFIEAVKNELWCGVVRCASWNKIIGPVHNDVA